MSIMTPQYHLVFTTNEYNFSSLHKLVLYWFLDQDIFTFLDEINILFMLWSLLMKNWENIPKYT